MESNIKSKKSLVRNLALVGIMVALVVAPFFICNNTEFTGTDDKANEAVASLKPGYKPWISPLWKPPSGEVESFLFSLQASIGSGVLGYFLGYLRGKKRRKDME